MTRADALREAAQRLAAAGVPSPARESRLLGAYALGLSAEALFLEPAAPLAPDEAHRLEACVRRRARREPFAYIAGRRAFWTLDMATDPRALIPRPETETLVEAALARASALPLRARLLDLGTGSGCLLVALLRELPGAWGVGADASAGAVALARRNARAHGVGDRSAFVVADWGAPMAGRFHAILCNPPYVADGEIAQLAPEIARHEPRSALSGGADGLACYRRLAPEIARLLAPTGFAAVEIGAGMGDAVSALFGASGLTETGRARDLAGRERCVLFSAAADAPRNKRAGKCPAISGRENKGCKPWQPE